MALSKKRLLALTLCAGAISASAFTLKTAYAGQADSSSVDSAKNVAATKEPTKEVENKKDDSKKGVKMYVYSTTYKDATDKIRAEHEENCKAVGLTPKDNNKIDIPLAVSRDESGKIDRFDIPEGSINEKDLKEVKDNMSKLMKN